MSSRAFTRWAPVALVVTACSGRATTADPSENTGRFLPDSPAELGPLPTSPLGTIEIAGVRGELSLPHLVDPTLVAHRIPRELRMIRLRDIAQLDTAAAGYLDAHPDRGEWILGSLGVGVVDTLRLNDRPVAIRPATFAWWWAASWPAPELDARSSPGSPSPGWVQLASWIADPSQRSQIWSNAEVVGVSAQREPPGRWQLELDAPDVRVKASCSLTGERTATDLPAPAYVTVWDGGSSVSLFTVFALVGHHSQPCVAEWSAEGTHPLARTLQRVSASEMAFLARGPTVQDGWRVRSGRYRH